MAVASALPLPTHRDREQGVPVGDFGHCQEDTDLPQLSGPGQMLKETLQQINYLNDFIFFMPASASSGLRVILSAVLAGIGDVTVLAASATLSPQSPCGEAVVLPPRDTHLIRVLIRADPSKTRAPFSPQVSVGHTP